MLYNEEKCKNNREKYERFYFTNSRYCVLIVMRKVVFCTIYERIFAEYKRLEEKEKLLRQMLQKFPDGKLICAKNGKGYKWYKSDGHNKIYIPKKERQFAQELATKKYITYLLEDLIHEKIALNFYLKHHKTGKAEKLLTDMSEYQELLVPYFQPVSQELHDWMNSTYERNKKYPEQLIIKASSGNMVRSKSEAMIDMALFSRKIPFRYEYILQLGRWIFYPDFTIRHPVTGELYYWEHFGRMDDEEYAKNAYAKLQKLNSFGIIPSINLIVTYETKDKPLSPEMIEKIVEYYFG